MPDENNPTIYIEYGAAWDSLKEYAIKFTTKNGGIFKSPSLELTLKNTNGRYTGNGSITLTHYSNIRVRADVRGTIDLLFQGKIKTLNSNNKDKREILTITAKGTIIDQLLRDSITKKYLELQNTGVIDYTMKQVIENMLLNPDSGIAKTFALQTDTGDINTVKAKHNFDRTPLLDAIQNICEYVGYFGYEDISQNKLYLYPYGWQATNPAITIDQDDDALTDRGFETSSEELYNLIMVWASPQVAYPDKDRFTEGGYAKGYWSGNTGTTVSDETTIKTINEKSIKGYRSTAGIVALLLDMTSLFPSGIDIQTKLLTNLIFHYYQDYTGTLDNSLFMCPTVYLYDSALREIQWTRGSYAAPQPKASWYAWNFPLGAITTDTFEPYGIIWDDFLVENRWYASTPEIRDAFDWKIKKIKIVGDTLTSGSLFNCIDGLHFEGAVPINPIEDSDLAAKDQTSIDTYGLGLLHYDEPAVVDYAVIYPLAEKILANSKNPLIHLTAKYGAKTWVKPNQYVTANFPIYGISSQQYRIIEIEQEWESATKLLRSTFHLTPRTQPVTSREWYRGQIEGLLKNLTW